MDDIEALLGRIALREGGSTVAVGAVTRLIEWAMIVVTSNLALMQMVF